MRGEGWGVRGEGPVHLCHGRHARGASTRTSRADPLLLLPSAARRALRRRNVGHRPRWASCPPLHLPACTCPHLPTRRPARPSPNMHACTPCPSAHPPARRRAGWGCRCCRSSPLWPRPHSAGRPQGQRNRQRRRPASCRADGHGRAGRLPGLACMEACTRTGLGRDGLRPSAACNAPPPPHTHTHHHHHPVPSPLPTPYQAPHLDTWMSPCQSESPLVYPPAPASPSWG